MTKKWIGISTFVLAYIAGIDAAFADVANAAATNAVNWGPIGAGLAIGLAALGGAVGQGKVVSAMLEASGRNPSAAGKLFVPMILGMALIESLVILGFVIAISQ